MENAAFAITVIQALAVLIACGSVLMIVISIFRSIGSMENRVTRIDSLLDHIERRTKT